MWVEAHCIVPDGFRKGAPFRFYGWQFSYQTAFYTVRGDAEWIPENPLKATAFRYRRGLLIAPQKIGKNPYIATQVCLEGDGPALFAGWAGKDDGWSCADHGCSCGWEYPYDPGEPMGMRWPTPLIQITAFSVESTDNTFDVLRPMIDDGPLTARIPKTGEEFIRLPGGGRIDVVTSSAQSRLGQRVTFVPQDEVGIWTRRNGMDKVADTQYRGLAGMGGRASLTSNAWDPAEQSVAQREYESKATDIYRQFTQPPAGLSFGDKRERRKIYQVVYEDSLRAKGGHVEIEAIDAEASDIAARDLPQAARFFGNIVMKGGGRAFDVQRFIALAVPEHYEVPRSTVITLGFDGSRIWDATALIGTVVATGYQWPIGVWERPPELETWEVPANEVDEAVAFAFRRWSVWRLYGDPPFWESNLSTWAGLYGKDRVIEWRTNRPKAMGYAYRAWSEAQRTGELSHCALDDPHCPAFVRHVGNAMKHETEYFDLDGKLWYAEKESTNSPDKIDCVPAAALSWEARNDAITEGVNNVPTSAYAGLTPEQVRERMAGA